MWQRVVRLLATSVNIYAFYSNPFKYLLSLALVVLIPYAVYIFWGTLALALLAGVGFYFLIRWISSTARQRVHHS